MQGENRAIHREDALGLCKYPTAAALYALLTELVASMRNGDHPPTSEPEVPTSCLTEVRNPWHGRHQKVMLPHAVAVMGTAKLSLNYADRCMLVLTNVIVKKVLSCNICPWFRILCVYIRYPIIQKY